MGAYLLLAYPTLKQVEWIQFLDLVQFDKSVIRTTANLTLF